jgi:IclR family KDG regulon transcriptional repressor
MTLKELGYIEQDELTPRYRITYKFQCLYSPDVSLFQIKKELKPVLENITQITKETSYLAIQMGSYFRHELKCEPNRSVRISLELGKEYEMTTTAIGKVFLSYSDHLQNSLIRFNDDHFNEQLKQDVAAIRENGYALDIQQYEPDLNCLAVPVFHQRKVIAVVCVSGPSYRFGEPEINSAFSKLRELLSQLDKYSGKQN